MSNDKKDTSQTTCGFCGKPKNEVKRLIAGGELGPFICNRCVTSAFEAMAEADNKARAKGEKEAPLLKPQEIRAFMGQHVIGQDRACRDVAVAVYNHYKRREALKNGFTFEDGPVEIQKSNIILLGPSGTGKTEIARALARLFKVPFHVGDATRLTAAGYVGDDVESLLQGLVRAANNDIAQAEWGIIFVDEIDKIARKSGRSPSGYKDVGGEAVQQSLLKIVEGGEVVIPREQGARMTAGSKGDVINTTNILFICAGSFAGIDEIVGDRQNKSSGLGFGAKERQRFDTGNVYAQVTKDDVLEFGILPEFLGRLPVLTSTYELTEAEMVRILIEPKNSIIRQLRALWAMDQIDLQFDPEALVAIAKEAKKDPTGARALRSIVERVLAPYAYDAPSMPGLKALRVTTETVAGGPAVLVQEGASQAVG